MDRRVKSIRKDRSGNIVALCNPDEKWSPRRKSDVIADIKGNKRSYYVHEADRRSYVRIVSGDVLQTTSDATSRNNLGNLPNI
jgi:hypothetical protein